MSGEADRTPGRSSLRFREGLAVLSVVGWTFCSALSHAYGLWSAIGGGALALAVAGLGADRGKLLAQLRPATKPVALGAAAGLAMIAATYLCFPFVRHVVPAVVPQAVALYATFGQESGWRAALLLPVVAVAEEIVWRGAVQNVAEEQWGPLLGVMAAAIAYSAAVIPVGSPLLCAIALGCGLTWSGLKSWTGSLVAPIVAHLLWVLMVLLLFPLVSG